MLFLDHQPVAHQQQVTLSVAIRRRTMKGYYGQQNELKTVISLRRKSSSWIVLRIIAMYASVDSLSLLPLLILLNVLSTWHVLHVIFDYPI
jgi:hypothetical protein